MENVLAKVREAFRAALNTDPQLISMETNPDSISGWDSIGHLTLASSLEERFNINLDVDDLMEMENVRAIVRIVKSKLNGGRDGDKS